jgi:hypothetical protein
VAGRATRRIARGPGPRASDQRWGSARDCAGREPAARGFVAARGGQGLQPADQRLRPQPGERGRGGRQEPQPCREHGTSLVIAGAGATPGRRGELSASQARALLAAADPVALAEVVVRRGLNVRATEQLVQRRTEAPPSKQHSRDADTVALERKLAAVLGLCVTLEAKKRGGTLTLHYASLDQLDRVLSLLRGS